MESAQSWTCVPEIAGGFPGGKTKSAEDLLGTPNCFRVPGTRTLYLSGEINGSTAHWCNILLLQLEAEDKSKDARIYINSPGGSVIDGLAIIDTMNLVSYDVSTVCVGMAASMASVILMCGTKGKRYMLTHSEVMIHQPMGGTKLTQAANVEIMTAHLKHTRDVLYEVMAKATGQSVETIREDCDRDKFLFATTDKGYDTSAVDYGVVDHVIWRA